MNHLKMLEDIDALVETDFVMEMETKLGAGTLQKYTQGEAAQMAQLLGKVYSIAHAIDCTSCNKKYE